MIRPGNTKPLRYVGACNLRCITGRDHFGDTSGARVALVEDSRYVIYFQANTPANAGFNAAGAGPRRLARAGRARHQGQHAGVPGASWSIHWGWSIHLGRWHVR